MTIASGANVEGEHLMTSKMNETGVYTETVFLTSHISFSQAIGIITIAREVLLSYLGTLSMIFRNE